MDKLDKRDKLQAIARKDFLYNVWKNTYEEAAGAYEDFVKTQPEEIQELLWAYTTGGELMNRRLAMLACEHMDFIDKK